MVKLRSKTDKIFRVRITANGQDVPTYRKYNLLFKKHPDYHDSHERFWQVGQDMKQWENMWSIYFINVKEEDKKSIIKFCKNEIRKVC